MEETVHWSSLYALEFISLESSSIPNCTIFVLYSSTG